MSKAVMIYIFAEVGIVLIAILFYIFWGNRYRHNQGLNIPPGFEKTDEVTIDPKTAKRLRVYFNRATGERFYHEEQNR